MTASSSDLRVIACNYTEPTSAAAAGALAYVRWTSGSPDRLPLLVRSRSGRWIQKWESLRRLGNFRVKTVPPEAPRYALVRATVGTRNEEAAQQMIGWITSWKETM